MVTSDKHVTTQQLVSGAGARPQKIDDLIAAQRPIDVLLIEDNRDCADALEALLYGVPVVRSVTIAASLRAAIAECERSGLRPAVVFVAGAADGPGLSTLRQTIGDAVIVLLCVYPERLPYRDIASQVDYCVSKDTGRRDLAQLLSSLQPPAMAAD